MNAVNPKETDLWATIGPDALVETRQVECLTIRFPVDVASLKRAISDRLTDIRDNCHETRQARRPRKDGLRGRWKLDRRADGIGVGSIHVLRVEQWISFDGLSGVTEEPCL
jgi:hypothetical protein